MKNEEKMSLKALAEKAKSIATTQEMAALVGGGVGIVINIEDIVI
ncbi:MAG: hypothetical protein ACFB10_19515 [Salibacteraceae bacterium]